MKDQSKSAPEKTQPSPTPPEKAGTSGGPPEKAEAEAAPAPPALRLVAFALEKRKDGIYLGHILEVHGEKVTQRKVVETDDYRPVVESVLDRASHELWRNGNDPFETTKVGK